MLQEQPGKELAHDPTGAYIDPVSGDAKENIKNAFGVLQRVADRYLRKE
jgi:hypothetical protein